MKNSSMLEFGLLVFHKLPSLVSPNCIYRNRETLTKNAEFSNTVFQAIFIRDVDETLSVAEEFLGLVPKMDTTAANDILTLVRVLTRVGDIVRVLTRVGDRVDWPRAANIAIDSASSIMGKTQVLRQNLEKKYR